MNLTDREFWGLVHGMGLGALFLLAFGGGLAGLWSLRPALVTEAGVGERVPRLKMGLAIMAIAAWLTVITGTWIVYPWYRGGDTEVCEGVALEALPGECGAKFELLANEETSGWHEFAMEWKEHVAWIAPFLATAVAFAVAYYGVQLARRGDVRNALIVFFTLAFLAAGAAGLFGAFITKAAPVA